MVSISTMTFIHSVGMAISKTPKWWMTLKKKDCAFDGKVLPVMNISNSECTSPPSLKKPYSRSPILPGKKKSKTSKDSGTARSKNFVRKQAVNYLNPSIPVTVVYLNDNF